METDPIYCRISMNTHLLITFCYYDQIPDKKQLKGGWGIEG